MMIGEPMNIPTDTLIDLLFAFLSDGVALTATDAAKILQIEHELQRRENEQQLGSRSVN
jgi:hypothetical protein